MSGEKSSPTWPPAVTSGAQTIIYPCNRGTSWPLGYHYFQASPNGVVVCIYCGKRS